jgi:hypothetical protein
MRALVIAVAAVAVGACIPEDGPMMEPGRDCNDCHGDGEAPRWTLSGTVYARPTAGEDEGVRGARIHVTDRTGRRVTITSNEAGNFYTAESLHFPLRVAVERGGELETMDPEVERGGCNGCHTWPPVEPDVEGRIHLSSGE